jgi:hypothetical protein
MTIIKKSYLNIYDNFTLHTKTNLPDWYVNSSKRKIVRVLGITATITDTNWVEHTQPPQIRFPPEIRLFSNLAKDEPCSNIPKLKFSETEVVGIPEDFNFIMMLNNYNSVKEFDITYSNIKQLEFSYVTMGGFKYETFGTNVVSDIVIELELVLAEFD